MPIRNVGRARADKRISVVIMASNTLLNSTACRARETGESAISGAAVDLSIIIPVLNEAAIISQHLEVFRRLMATRAEFIFVDGGSEDDTAVLLREHDFHVLESPPGRAKQMNLGARHAQGKILLFLHIDSRLPEDFSALRICGEIDASRREWGFFSLNLSQQGWLYRWISCGINFRARVFRVATGDQGMFIQTKLFRQLGGFKEIELMEDVELSRRLKRRSSPLILPDVITASARRWQSRGVIKTIVLMWSLQLAYKVGVSPRQIHRWYY